MPMANAYKPNTYEDKPFEAAPEGDYDALCYQMIDIGTQSVTYNNETTYKNQIAIIFELHGPHKMADGRPFIMVYREKGRLPTLSLNPKANLRKMLSAWRGKPITEEETHNPSALIKSFLGKPAAVTITHREYLKKDGSKGLSVDMSMPVRLHPSVNPPKLVNDLVFFDIGNWDESIFQALKGWKASIEASAEFKERGLILPPTVSTASLTPINPNTGLPSKTPGGNAIGKKTLEELPDDFSDSIPF